MKQVQEDAESIRGRISECASRVEDRKLDEARDCLKHASMLKQDESDPETTKQAMDNVLEAKKLLAQVRKDHLKEIRQLDLDRCVAFFNEHLRKFARTTEFSSFDSLVRASQRSIDSGSTEFESLLRQLNGKNLEVLWRQDWFAVDWFKRFAAEPHFYPDSRQHAALIAAGSEAIKADDIEKLRQVVAKLSTLRMGTDAQDEMLAAANILRAA